MERSANDDDDTRNSTNITVNQRLLGRLIKTM